MKKTLILFLFVFCLGSLSVYARDISEDILTTKKATPLVNGKKEGVERLYDKNGTLRKEITYKNGKWNGIVRDYRKDGSLRSEISYVDNKEQGSFKSYDFDGNLLDESFWKDGVMQESCSYRNGKKEECRRTSNTENIRTKAHSTENKYKSSKNKKKSQKYTK